MQSQGTPDERCSLADYADAAAEAVRGLNHATFAGTGYEVPSDVYDVLGQLSTMLARLPQALSQAADWLAREQAAGHVGHDQLTNAGAVAAAVAGVQGAPAQAP